MSNYQQILKGVFRDGQTDEFQYASTAPQTEKAQTIIYDNTGDKQTQILHQQIKEAERQRKINFIRKHDQFTGQLKIYDQNLDHLESINHKLRKQLQEQSNELDRLIQDNAEQAYKIEKREIVVKTKKCDHLPLMEQMNKELDNYQSEIVKTSNRIDQAMVYKDNELKNVKDKIIQAQNESKSLAKKGKLNEQKQIMDLETKIQETEQNNKDMDKEIKLLKRLQHHQGNRLLDLDNPDQFPEKIKQLMEEKKFNEDKIKEMLKNEQAEVNHVERQEQIIELAQNQIKQLNFEIENMEIDDENQEILQQIQDTESQIKFLEVKVENKDRFLNRLKLPDILQGKQEIKEENLLPIPQKQPKNFLKGSSPFMRNHQLESSKSEKISPAVISTPQKILNLNPSKHLSHQKIAKIKEEEKQQKLKKYKDLKMEYSFQLKQKDPVTAYVENNGKLPDIAEKPPKSKRFQSLEPMENRRAKSVMKTIPKPQQLPKKDSKSTIKELKKPINRKVIPKQIKENPYQEIPKTVQALNRKPASMDGEAANLQNVEVGSNEFYANHETYSANNPKDIKFDDDLDFLNDLNQD